MENENETCEFCGKIIAEMHYWNLESFPLPIVITPRYDDKVLSLCQRCFEKWEELAEEKQEELAADKAKENGGWPYL